MSVHSYVRLRCPLEEAMARYGRWIGAPEVSPPRLVRERDAIELAVANGEWRGLAVLIFASGQWTVFEELSVGWRAGPQRAGCSSPRAGTWCMPAMVYAGYNDSVPYAQLIVVERGRLVRQYLQDEQDSSADVDLGQLPQEAKHPFSRLDRCDGVGGRG